jgi:hypothetical protein
MRDIEWKKCSRISLFEEALNFHVIDQRAASLELGRHLDVEQFLARDEKQNSFKGVPFIDHQESLVFLAWAAVRKWRAIR